MRGSGLTNKLPLHCYNKGDIALFLSFSTLNFRHGSCIFIKAYADVDIAAVTHGQRNSNSFIGGHWVGRLARRIVLVEQDTQTSQKDFTTLLKP